MSHDPICILTTGGTIDKIYFDALSEYQVGAPTIAGLLAEGGVRCPFRIVSILRKDSLDITEADRELIRDTVIALPERRVLITHGTDTMVETGKALARVESKAIVLVGSLKPANFKDSDAVFNIAFALGALQSLPDGVYIAMNGCVFDPFKVTKNRVAGRFEALD